MIYKLPPTFYYDHVSRELPAGTFVRETKRSVFVELPRADYDEILSDARHYSESMGEGGFEEHGIIASARATVRRLEAAGPPEETTS